jgi:hypothetical protein
MPAVAQGGARQQAGSRRGAFGQASGIRPAGGALRKFAISKPAVKATQHVYPGQPQPHQQPAQALCPHSIDFRSGHI